MKNFLLILSISFSGLSLSQTKELKQDSVISFIDCPPQFPGGDKALMLYLRDNTDLAEIDHNKFEFEKIYVTFYVETDGSITEMDILNYKHESIKGMDTKPFDTMPSWTPACDKNGPIRERVILPIYLHPSE